MKRQQDTTASAHRTRGSGRRHTRAVMRT